MLYGAGMSLLISVLMQTYWNFDYVCSLFFEPFMQPDGIELVYEDGKGGGRIIIIFMRYYGLTDQQPVRF